MHIFNKVLIKMNFVIKTGLIALFLLIFYTENFSQPLDYYFRHFIDNQCKANLKSVTFITNIVYVDYLDSTRNNGNYGLIYSILDVSDEKRDLHQIF